ncbi:MAG: T9SS type A sorting domain-containing protein [Dysgonamonadaceae bacterium]|jgi:hypothetical protein|nr:T9SS type A sorting domain-containing protein [Dysgonamonadaceae bacterium]
MKEKELYFMKSTITGAHFRFRWAVARIFILVVCTLFFAGTTQAQSAAAPKITGFPTSGTYAKNAPMCFYLQALSPDGGYLTYQWKYSTDPEGANPQPVGGNTAILSANSPAVAGTYYLWCDVTNNKGGETYTESTPPVVLTVVDRTLPDHIINGDMEYWRSTPVANQRTVNGYPSTGGTDKNGNTFQYHNWLNEWRGTPTGPNSSYYPNEAGGTFASDAHHDPANGWYTTHQQWSPGTSIATGTVLPYGIVEVSRLLFYNRSGINLSEAGHGVYVAELGANTASNLYQDIATVPGKIYEWSLDHTARPGITTQKMAVVIGKNINKQADYGAGATNRWNLKNGSNGGEGYTYGLNITSYFNDIVNKLVADRGVSLTTIADGGYTTSYNGSTYYIYIGSDITDSNWAHHSGSYTVPSGQGATVFAFVYVAPTGQGNGNILDNIVFASSTMTPPSASISYENVTSITVENVRSGFAYGLSEVRGSSVSTVGSPSAFVGGASLTPSSSLGDGKWYVVDAPGSDLITGSTLVFKDLGPGRTYRVVGVPVGVISPELGANLSSSLVLDENYYADTAIPVAANGDGDGVSAISMYIDGATAGEDNVVLTVENTLNSLLYAIIDDSGSQTPGPEWVTGTGNSIIFSGLKQDTKYKLIARPSIYSEEEAMQDVVWEQILASAIEVTTPTSVNISGLLTLEDVSCSADRETITLAKNYGSADVFDLSTGKPVTGSNGIYAVDPSKIYTVQDKYMEGTETCYYKTVARVYPFPEYAMAIEYESEMINYHGDNILNTIAYKVDYAVDLSPAVDITGWIIGAGSSKIPLDEPYGSVTTAILDDVPETGAKVHYRLNPLAVDGYAGAALCPEKTLDLPARPAGPVITPDYGNETLTVEGTGLPVSFASSGWNGNSAVAYKASFPAVTDGGSEAFRSGISSFEILARRAAPAGIGTANGKFSGLTGDISYEYKQQNDGTTWETVSGEDEDYLDNDADVVYLIRFSATNEAVASHYAIISASVRIEPVTETVAFEASLSYPLVITGMEGVTNLVITVDEDDNELFSVTGSGANWTLSNRVTLSGAGTFTATLKASYTHNSADHSLDIPVSVTVSRGAYAQPTGLATSAVAGNSITASVSDLPTGATVEFRIGSEPWVDGTDKAITFTGLAPSTLYRISARTKDDANHDRSERVETSVYTAYATPVISALGTVNYPEETFVLASEINPAYYLFKINDGEIANWNRSLTPYAGENIQLCVMHKSGTGNEDMEIPASAWSAVLPISGRPTAPAENFTATPESSIGKGDGNLTESDSEGSYSNKTFEWSNGGNWTAFRGTSTEAAQINNLQAGTYLIRYPAVATAGATEGHFASLSKNVIIETSSCLVAFGSDITTQTVPEFGETGTPINTGSIHSNGTKIEFTSAASGSGWWVWRNRGAEIVRRQEDAANANRLELELTSNCNITCVREAYTCELDVTPPQSICLGGSTDLTKAVKFANNNVNASIHYYTNVAGTEILTDLTVSPPATTIYYARGESSSPEFNGTIKSLTVTVNPLPTPSISPSGNTVYAGETISYMTTADMIDYQWTLSPSGSGSITNPQTATATVTWNSTPGEDKTLSVAFTNPITGCTGTADRLVEIIAQPDPVITGSSSVCKGAAEVVYSTAQNNYSYDWSVTGGEITEGDNTYQIKVTWTSTSQTGNNVKLKYKSAVGAPFTELTTYPVEVKQAPGVATIAVDAAYCEDTELDLTSPTATQTVCEDNTLSLTTPTVDNKGSAITDEYWTLDGTEIDLTTYRFQTSDNGKALAYYAQNGCGYTSSTPVTVNVSAKVTITAQPSILSPVLNPGEKINPGTAFTLSVTATGNIASYKWYKDGTAIPASNATTFTKTAAPADKGYYHVAITGTCGETETSNTVYVPASGNDATLSSLTVDGKPVSGFDPGNTSYTVYGDCNLENTVITATANHPAAAINPGNTINASLNPGNNPFSFTVTAEDLVTTKTYQINVVRDCGAPVILKHPEDAIICVNDNHTFELEVEGEGFTYEWYYNGSRIPGANTNSYTITNAKPSDYGRYHVIVRSNHNDFHASAYSRQARLWVSEQLPETLKFVTYPDPAITGNTYHIQLVGYSDVTQYVWSYRVGATLVVAQNAVAQNTNDGVTFSPETGTVGENETWATFGTLSAGTGTITATLTHPCGTREATQTIRVTYPMGTEAVTAAQVAVYPNPTTGVISISNTVSNRTVKITDITGSLKGSYKTQEGATTIDLSGYAKGTYLVQYDGKMFKVVRK